jgi:S-adenosyl-L-methionine hydrolase (adenosine-forming)
MTGNVPPYSWITLTTDYGLADGFVAVLHGVIARHAPAVRVLDVTHQVPLGDIRRGAAVLAQSVAYLPRAVHVVVVDPGVGTARRGIAVAAGECVLVGPDNGVLPPAADVLGGGAARAVELTNPAWLTQPVSATFHGRDVFAPAAAQLAAGVPLDAAGPVLDPAELVRLPEPLLRHGPGYVEAEVMLVDRFGNVELAAPAELLTGLPALVELPGAAGLAPARIASTFGDVSEGELVVYPDSAGRVALALNRGDAAAALGLGPGDVVRIQAARGTGTG